MVFYTGGLTMKFTKAGIILNTQKYQECVDFYGAILSLDIMFKINRPGEKITTFALGDVYLMIEPDGHAQVGKKSVAQPNFGSTSMTYRPNVPHFDAKGCKSSSSTTVGEQRPSFPIPMATDAR